jgi:hypothetical protein
MNMNEWQGMFECEKQKGEEFATCLNMFWPLFAAFSNVFLCTMLRNSLFAQVTEFPLFLLFLTVFCSLNSSIIS